MGTRSNVNCLIKTMTQRSAIPFSNEFDLHAPLQSPCHLSMMSSLYLGVSWQDIQRRGWCDESHVDKDEYDLGCGINRSVKFRPIGK